MFAQWLRHEGYDVRTAPDGEAALLCTAGVDAVIVDARMPVLDGLGFIRRLRERHEDAAVALATGDYMIEDTLLDECQRLGARIVFKPLWLDDMVALAGQLVARGPA